MEKAFYVVMQIWREKPIVRCMAHSSIPIVIDFPKADAKTSDLRVKGESSPAYMLVFAVTYAIGVLLTLGGVALFCHWHL